MSVHFDEAAERATVAAFLDAASARIDNHPERMAFKIPEGRLVLAWLRYLNEHPADVADALARHDKRTGTGGAA